jgi:hypothetical protein
MHEQDDDHAHGEPHERRDAAARAGDLDAMAGDAADATYGDTDERRARVPGWLSGEVGPKGKVSAQLRENARTERPAHGEVPRGTVSSGGAHLVLLPMLVIAVLLIAVVALVGWLLA